MLVGALWVRVQEKNVANRLWRVTLNLFRMQCNARQNGGMTKMDAGHSEGGFTNCDS